MGITENLARFIIDTNYDDFPKKVITAAKERILDCLGTMIGGSCERASQILIKYVKDSGGVPESGVIGGGFRTSLTNAVFINATSGHTLELEPGGKHWGSEGYTVVPVALNVAEKFKLSGKAILEAVILGWELYVRITRGAFGVYTRGFASFGAPGPIAYAAGASKMLKLSLEQTCMAIGLAASQCGGLSQNGTMCHYLEGGFGARNGITAVLLSKEGMTAQSDIIEGTRGYLEVLCGKDYDLELLSKDLGNPLYLLSPGITLKKYGCCFFQQSLLDALFQLVQEHNIHYNEVDKIEVEVHPHAIRSIRFRDPQNGDQAKFSIHHALGAAILDGKVDLRTFSDEGAADPKYIEPRKKVNVVVQTKWQSTKDVHSVPPPLSIKLKDGRTYTRTLDVIKGSPELPLSEEEFFSRYETSIRGVLSSQQIRRSIDLVSNLENLPHILELMELVTFGKGKNSGGKCHSIA